MLYKEKQNGATFTWHVAKAKVSDAVIIVEEDVECVQSPRGLHQQTRPQRHHKPRRKFMQKIVTISQFSCLFQVLVIFSCGLFYALHCYVQITSTPRQAARPPWSAASSG